MKNIISLILLISTFSVSIFAAAPDFSVVASNGEVMVKRDKATNWVKLASGQKLFQKDQIQIGKNAYLGLVHSSGSPVEVKNSGNYSVQKLVAQATTKKSNVTKKFTDYIVGELSKSDDQVGKDNYRKDMETMGAVERGSSKGLTAKLPRSSYTLDNKMDFSWYKKEGVTTYKFVIKDSEGKKIVDKDVNGTNLTIDLAQYKMKKGDCYNWSVSSNGASTEEYCILKFGDNEAKQVNQELTEIQTEIGKNPGAVGQLILASFYEEKNIVNRAVAAYEAAIKISPIESYKRLYSLYLNRLGLKNEAQSVMK